MALSFLVQLREYSFTLQGQKSTKKEGHPRYSRGCPMSFGRPVISTVDVLTWRSGRDSNPRAAYDRHTISSRARYDLFDTTAQEIWEVNETYYSQLPLSCQDKLS